MYAIKNIGVFIVSVVFVSGVFALHVVADRNLKETRLKISVCVATHDGDVAKLTEDLMLGANPNDGPYCFEETLLQHAQTMAKQHPEQVNRVRIIHFLKAAGAK